MMNAKSIYQPFVGTFINLGKLKHYEEFSEIWEGRYKGGTIRVAKVPPHKEEWTMWDENMSCCGGDGFITTGTSVSDCMDWLWANGWFEPMKNGTC